LTIYIFLWSPVKSGSVIHDYRSADPDPKEIFRDPELNEKMILQLIFYIIFIACLSVADPDPEVF
jgi:hypothetical protein